jgi:hypothetical protein
MPPNKWWPGFHDGDLNHGQNSTIKLEASSLHHFQVKLNDKPGAHHAMPYDSVLLKADKEQQGYLRYCLPSCCPGNPDKDSRSVSLQKIGWMVDNDYINKKDVAINKAIEFNNRDNDDDHDNMTMMMTFTGRLQKQRRGRKGQC